MSVRPWNPDLVGGPSVGAQARQAYELGAWFERRGDLDRAAAWFRSAAEARYPGAALRLGGVLGRILDERGTMTNAATGTKGKQSPEKLLAEATRWLSEVKTSPDAVELITDLLNRQQRLAARRPVESMTVG